MNISRTEKKTETKNDMKHAIFTRCNFQDDIGFEKYWPVMKEIYIPSLKSQTCKNFILYLNTKNPKHRAVISEQFKDCGFELAFIDFWEGNKVNKLFNIQTRHDCDDYMSSEYICRLQDVYNENIEKYDEFLIQAQPNKFDFITKKEYISPIRPPTAPCMFLSLCQKNYKKYIYQEMHTRFSKLVPTVFDIGRGYTKLVIHGNNTLSKILPTDSLI